MVWILLVLAFVIGAITVLITGRPQMGLIAGVVVLALGILILWVMLRTGLAL
jgi:hypothetical protein